MAAGRDELRASGKAVPYEDELEASDSADDLSESVENLSESAEDLEDPGDGEGADPAAGPQVKRVRVRRSVAGRRLDRYMHGRFPRLSRTLIQKWIKDGEITVNDLPAKPSYEPKEGDIVRIVIPPPPPSEVVPQDIPLDILYEDEWLIVINKPIGMVCHPAYASQTGTIANAVAGYAERLSKGSDPFRPGIVHRLDKNTTGVMLIAKCDEAHWRVSLQFERRTVKKEYFAVVHGRVSLDGDVIHKPLAPHPDTTQRMILPGSIYPPRQAMFKEAITEYRVRRRYAGYTAVDLFPRTGRTHQLRVHMSSLGHPIVGDRLYGGRLVSERELSGEGSNLPLFEFQALHARRLRLVHPIRETPLDIEAPLPPHLARLVELLERHRNGNPTSAS